MVHTRRQFLATAAAAAAPRAARPNILVILTDQQHAGMLSCAGNPHVKTPNMDSLARTGVRFERAYVTNPVCLPSRFGLMTGRMPSAIGIECNEDGSKPVPDAILKTSLGNVFREGGYQTVYGGKVHLPGPEGRREAIEAYGFDVISRDQRGELAGTCADFLRQKHDRPFLMVTSLINPHDICFMAISAFAKAGGKPREIAGKGRMLPEKYLGEALRTPAGVSEAEFFARHCPPLPANLEPARDELSAFMIDKREFQKYVRKSWTDRDWRMHRWAYARLTEQVDREIGAVLDALRESGRENDTLVVLTSDHGDQDASHRLEHKEVLYEEAIHVPFIVSWKGVTRGGHVDREHLVSNGLDLIPTLCDFAGIRKPAALEGRSVRALAEGGKAASWRDCVMVENHLARLAHTGRWKYFAGRNGKHTAGCGICPDRIANWDGGPVREMLIDLQADPGETRNIAKDQPAQVAAGRALLRGLCKDEAYLVRG
ncbi:MAG: sulfatase [Bryobacteraceae bacterium]